MRTVALSLALLAAATDLPAQSPDTTTPKPARLFRASEPLTMWLEADFKAVFRDRDTTTGKTTRFPAKLRTVGEAGDTIALDVQLETRGHFRLDRRRGNCAFPPLKVYFDKEQTKGGLYGGEGSLKLATHCENGDRYTQNTLVEYAIYRLYNLMTPVSFKVRLGNLTWLDPANPKFTVTRPAFWLQDDEDLAKELRGRILEQKGAGASEMDPRQMAITDLFQYMIGNTDMSLVALHNYKIVQSDTGVRYFPLAYDFDWSGLVDAPYSFPDHRLGIKRTTDRLWRGNVCYEATTLDEVTKLFAERKDQLYGTLRDLPGITPGRAKEATSFLDEFYKELENPGKSRRTFTEPCRRS